MPAAPSQPIPGLARLEVTKVSDQSALTSSHATSPMKLLTPVPRGPSVWSYSSSFGGGLLAGDQTRLELHLGNGTRCFFGTQASTKIYRSPAGTPCGHATHARIDDDACLIFAPEPIQAFAHSVYHQSQEFHLAPHAGLVLIDWLSSGRPARGERWAFTRLQSRNQVFVGGHRILFDSLLLDPENGPLGGAHLLGRFNCLALAAIIGAPLAEQGARLLTEFAASPVLRRASLISSASPLQNGVLVRIAGEEVETVGHELRRILGFVTAILQGDPWERKW